MNLRKLFQLTRMNFRANFTRNIVYILIFGICIWMSLVALYCSNSVSMSLDTYLNYSTDAIRYRQFIVKPQSKPPTEVIEKLEAVEDIESIHYDLDFSNDILVTSKYYEATNSIVASIESLGYGTVFRKTEDMVEVSVINMVKTGTTLLLFFVALFVIVILKTNMTHSVEERRFEIALYISMGYSPWLISILLFVEIFSILIVALLISQLVFSNITLPILNPLILNFSREYLNVPLPSPKSKTLVMLIEVCGFICIMSVLSAKNKINKLSPAELLKS